MVHIIALQFQKSFFSHDPTPISGQVPSRSNYTMARNDDADRIMTDRSADGLSRHPFESALLCDFIGNPTVRDRLSKRNLAHDLADTIAEIGSYQMNPRKEPGIAA